MGSRSFDFHTPAQSLSTNFFVNFLRSEDPPVNTCAVKQQAAMLQEACIIINAVHVYDGYIANLGLADLCPERPKLMTLLLRKMNAFCVCVDTF